MNKLKSIQHVLERFNRNENKNFDLDLRDKIGNFIQMTFMFLQSETTGYVPKYVSKQHFNKACFVSISPLIAFICEHKVLWEILFLSSDCKMYVNKQRLKKTFFNLNARHFKNAWLNYKCLNCFAYYQILPNVRPLDRGSQTYLHLIAQ